MSTAISLAQVVKVFLAQDVEAVVLKAGQAPSFKKGQALQAIAGSGSMSNEELEKFLLSFVKPEQLRELGARKRLEIAFKAGAHGTFKAALSLEGIRYSCEFSRMAATTPGNGHDTPPQASAVEAGARPPAPSLAPAPAVSVRGAAAALGAGAEPEAILPSLGPGPEVAESTPMPAATHSRDALSGPPPSPPQPHVEPGRVAPDSIEARQAWALMEEMMGALLDQNGSDIHIKQDLIPILRIDGELRPHGNRAMTRPDILAVIDQITTPVERKRLADELQLDSAYSYKSLARFRVNVYNDLRGLGLALRLIPSRIPSWQELGLPKLARDLIHRGHGLLLVTGPTGSGKTTTLASLMRDLNEHEHKHVITIEDPIEFLHPDIKCSITQREVKLDTPTFAQGVIDAMRQDPDVLLVGEMRDIETMANVLLAAEAGRLVMATVHTTSAYQTVERILNAFPSSQQPQVRYQLAATLVGIISQALVPKKGGGRVAAIELLITNDAARALIRDAKPYGLQGVIETGASQGMRSLDQALTELLEANQISFENAFEKCQNPITFKKLEARFGGGGNG